MTDNHHEPRTSYTFLQLSLAISAFGAGLASLGSVAFGDNVALFAESSARWLVADQGIMSLGAVDAVRGVHGPAEELALILTQVEASALVVEDAAALAKVVAAASQLAGQGSQLALQRLRLVVLLWGEPSSPDGASGHGSGGLLRCPVLTFDQVAEAGRSSSSSSLSSKSLSVPVAPSSSDLASLVFTSGTTGQPKAAMLTHANFLSQLAAIGDVISARPGERVLSLLPPWHCYERTTMYFLLSSLMHDEVTWPSTAGLCCEPRHHQHPPLSALLLNCALPTLPPTPPCPLGLALRMRNQLSNVRAFRSDLEAAVAESRPPAFLVLVPLVLETLYKRIVATLASSGPVAGLLLRASLAFVRARRLATGASLVHALAPAPHLAVAWAALTSALLWPLHRLADVLVFSKIRAKLGVTRAAVSGGAALAPHIDDFFEAAGVDLLNGWGLTETSPVIACRTPSRNVRGTVGRPLAGTQVRAVDPSTRAPLPDGATGLLLAKGPGVMKGYYKDPVATGRAIDAEGWFDTGDLGYVVPRDPAAGPHKGPGAGPPTAGCIALVGRAKDTIVLSNGENVEPQALEGAILTKAVVRQVMIVGDRRLGALVVPDEEALCRALGLPEGSTAVPPGLAGRARAVVEAALEEALKGRPQHEQVRDRFELLQAPWTVEGGELTMTLKVRREENGGCGPLTSLDLGSSDSSLRMTFNVLSIFDSNVRMHAACAGEEERLDIQVRRFHRTSSPIAKY